MRYYSYNEAVFDNDGNLVGNEVITMSEEEIRTTYFHYWQQRMNKKFGEDCVKTLYVFEDCLNDWIVVNWAWEVTE